MNANRTDIRRLLSCVICLLPTTLLLAGCETGQPHYGQVHDDVVRIGQYFSAMPWLYDEAGTPSGVAVRLYLYSASTGKGVFVPGTIKVDMYGFRRLPNGRIGRELLHSWEFNEETARAMRMTKAAIMGDSYGMILKWPDDMDLSDRDVQFVYRYRRRDGGEIVRDGSHLRVPRPSVRAYEDIPPQSQGTPRTPAAPVPNEHP